MPVNNGLGDPRIYALAVEPTTPQVIYAATFEQGVYRSGTGAYLWVQDGLPNRMAYTVTVDGDGVAYAGTDGIGDGQGVYLRSLAGAWAPMASQPGAPVVRSLARCGTNLLAGTTDGIWWYGTE